MHLARLKSLAIVVKYSKILVLCIMLLLAMLKSEIYYANNIVVLMFYSATNIK
jgi:hypothetical protein